MITGRRYLLRGQVVTVLAQWATPRTGPGAAALPLVRLPHTAPRNVLIRDPDGTLSVRPFRGLRRIPEHRHDPVHPATHAVPATMAPGPSSSFPSTEGECAMPVLAPPAGAPSILAANGHPVLDSAVPEPPRQDPDTDTAEPLGGGWLTVTVVIGVMAALIALGGMTLSFRSVRDEMVPAFGARWAALVPLVTDLTVFVFSGVDLVLTRLKMSHPLARWTVYGATAGTVWLNYSAGGGTAGRVAHVLMPSIWVMFVELMRHVVRYQAHLAGGTIREPIPSARWLVSPWPTLKLWRRMVLWRQHSYRTALAMERTRLGAIAVARQMHGWRWRKHVGPLIRLQIDLAELDAAAVAAALALAAQRPPNGHDQGQNPDTDADPTGTAPGHGDGHAPDTGTDKTRTPKRTRAGQDTKAKVVKLKARHPDLSAEDIAKRLNVTARTVRRHLGGR
ncbi:MAG TPA: DUF2637 domain-containing protein [Actinocrinis sp.]|uniref:DUF2637 domain-containing protein n=1 Tax=Actinocrinis sp. TaxID=1920516 RepID=UPI002DDD4725|nr:DUF2637 domain-containing protein [Actinocrinis sp.]HEV2343459.1 DUF2637 domain-containing protein [Actinocrinis sp.]